MTGVSAGRVGRPHGRDGSFYVEDVSHPLVEGGQVALAGSERRIERRAGTDERPLIRLAGIDDRDAIAALQGEILLVDAVESPLAADEWLVADLVGCEVEGLGYVERVLDGPSCDVLEVGEEGILIPFVADAVKRIDREARVIEVDRRFLGL
ncbi:MAG: ribosome maturation factor RimM [Thermoleophilaceae bacterium]